MKISLFEKTDRVDRPFMAIALVLIGVFVLAAQDTFIKLMSVETSFWQFQTLRSLSNLCLLFLLALISGGLSLLVPINKHPETCQLYTAFVKATSSSIINCCYR